MTVCIERSLVDAHFEGSAPEHEPRLRGHLRECAACRDYYGRRVLLATLDPAAMPLEDRLAAGLGLAGPRAQAGVPTTGGDRASRFARPKVALFALVAAAAVVLFWFLARPSRDDGFASRGGHAPSAPHVRIFRAEKGGVPEPLSGPMRRTDELAFAYETTPGNDTLMIFGLDEHGHVYWFHPAWSDPAANPQAVPAATSPELHPLREAIAHDLDGRTLEIHALFSHEARTVRAVEAALAGKTAPAGALTLGATVDVVTSVEVLP